MIFETTNRCNLKCRMCTVWRRGATVEELNLSQIDILASRLRDLGVVVVSLSGGEPLEREDLEEIVRIFKGKGIITRLLTNAVKADEKRILGLIDAGIDSVSISLNTLFPEEEAYICRSDNSLWEKVVSNMALLSRTLGKRGSLLVMSICVSSLNVDQLPLLVEFASFMGFRANVMPTELAERREAGLRFSDHAPQLALATEDRVKFIKSMNVITKKRREEPILNSSRFLRSMRNFVLRPGYSEICDAGELYFVVDPTGRYSICHEFEPQDSLLSPGFVSRFWSPQFKEYWAKFRRNCNGCMHPCWMEVSNTFRYSGPLLQSFAHLLYNYRRRAPVQTEEALRFAASLRERLGRGPRLL